MRKTATLLFAFLCAAAAHGQNRGLHFDGANDYVQASEKPGVLTGNVFTVEAWIKPTALFSDFAGIVSKQAHFSDFLLCLNGSGTVATQLLQCHLSTDIDATSLHYPLPSSWVNQWHHVAVTFNGSTATLYVDGNAVQAMPLSGTLLLEGLPLQLGAYYETNLFNGVLDEVRIWNAARTQAQLQASMNTEVPPATASLKGYYRFNQGTANGNNTTITTLVDAVAPAAAGSLFNFARTGTASNFTAGYLSLVLLALRDDSFTAVRSGTAVRLAWQGTEEATAFRVERSADGVVFSTVGTVPGRPGPNYGFTDARPLTGTTFYRLQWTAPNGTTAFSKTVAVLSAGDAFALRLFPNPARHTVTLTAPAGAPVVVRDAAGRTVQTTTLSLGAATLYATLRIDHLPRGLYSVSTGGQLVLFVKE